MDLTPQDYYEQQNNQAHGKDIEIIKIEKIAYLFLERAFGGCLGFDSGGMQCFLVSQHLVPLEAQVNPAYLVRRDMPCLC